MTTRARHVAAAGVAALAALAWLHLAWQTLRPALNEDHWRTPSYWVAPRLALEGRSDVLYEDETFAAAAVGMGSIPDIWMPNPPVSVLPLLPLAALDELTARNLVLALNLAAAIAAVVLLGRAARLTALGWAAAALGLAVFQPVRHGIVWGQVYALVLLAIVVAAIAAARRSGPAGGRRLGPAGAILGAAAVFKYPFPIAAAGALFVLGRVRAAVIAGAILAAGVAATVAAWGIEPWQAWLAALGPWGDRPVHAVTALQMPRGLLTRLFEFHPEHSPSPIMDAPPVGDALWLALASVVGVGTLVALWRARRADAPLLGVAVAVPAALLLSPYVDDYAYVLALLPLAAAAMGLGFPGALGGEAAATGVEAKWPARSRSRWWTAGWLVLGTSALLLGAAIPFREAEPVGLEALLWYPRVYGTLLLWGLLVALAVRATPAGDGAGSTGRAATPAGPAGAAATGSAQG